MHGVFFKKNVSLLKCIQNRKNVPVYALIIIKFH